jgi:hypothetical protein
MPSNSHQMGGLRLMNAERNHFGSRPAAKRIIFYQMTVKRDPAQRLFQAGAKIAGIHAVVLVHIGQRNED